MTPLPAPIAPLAPIYGEAPELQGLINVVCDAKDWTTRVDRLDRALFDFVVSAIASDSGVEETLSRVAVGVTCALEVLGEHAVDGAEVALIYSLSTHREWHDPALALLPQDLDPLLATRSGLCLIINSQSRSACESQAAT